MAGGQRRIISDPPMIVAVEEIFSDMQADAIYEEIRAVLAGALGVELAQVSVKATRGEGMGFVGRQEGAAALALATIEFVA